MRSKPSIEYFLLLENLSKEKRKTVDVTLAKCLKVKAKQRKLLLQKTALSEGEGNVAKVSKESKNGRS